MTKTPETQTIADPAREPYLNRFDPFWIVLFISVIVINIWFGIHSLTQAQHVALTRKNAEAVLGWLKEKAPLREQQQPILPGCDSPAGRWADCLNSIVAADGPLPNIRNQLQQAGPVFADACDRNESQSLGAIVIEKGSPKPTDPTAVAYSRMPKEQDLSQKLLLKFAVCGRSFHVMNVGETTF